MPSVRSNRAPQIDFILTALARRGRNPHDGRERHGPDCAKRCGACFIGGVEHIAAGGRGFEAVNIRRKLTYHNVLNGLFQHPAELLPTLTEPAP